MVLNQNQNCYNFVLVPQLEVVLKSKEPPNTPIKISYMNPIRLVWPKEIPVSYQFYTSFNANYVLSCASQKSILDPMQPKTESPEP
jgi:hypothetical protein